MTHITDHADNEPRGLVLMLASLGLFSMTMLLNRLILQTEQVSAVQLFFYSSVVQICFSEVIRRRIHKQPMQPFLGSRRAMCLICVRQVFSVAGWVALTHLSSLLPIGYIQLNQNLIPVITAIMAYSFLRETVSRRETYALLVCFSVITATGTIKTVEASDEHGNGNGNGSAYSVGNVLLCLMSVVAFSAINIFGRLLKGFHYSVLCTAQFTLNAVFSLALVLGVFAVSDSAQLYVPATLRGLVLVLGLGVSRSLSTLLFVRACQLAKSQRISTLNYAQSIFGYAIDVFLFNYTLTLVEVIAILTVLGTGAVVFIETHKAQAPPQKPSNAISDNVDLEELVKPLIDPFPRASKPMPFKDFPGLKYKVIN